MSTSRVARVTPTANRRPTARRRAVLRRAIALLAVIPLVPALVSAGAADAGEAQTGPAEDPAVIAQWNALAVSTFNTDTSKKPPGIVLYVGLVQAAVYDAVVGVHGRYEPYLFPARAPRHTSAQAAAVAAAHEVLVTYSPQAATSLDAAYAASLAQIPDGIAKDRGVDYGTRVADHLIAVRQGDGREAPVLFPQPPSPGVWRPTAPTFTPMLDPWLGGVTPLLVHSATQFAPPPPPSLTSAAYAADFTEVKAMGSKTSTVRTDDQTRTALFFSGNATVQFNTALRDQMVQRHLDLTDTARMYAAIDLSAADGLITVWRAKLRYGFWRPVTAINLADTDDNPATLADPTWQPLAATPAYPEYPSGYNVFTAAVTGGLAYLFGTDHVDLTLTSTAVSEVRHYATGSAVRADVVDARVWLGFHFRTADIASRDLGLRLTAWALGHYFRPTGEGDRDQR